MVQQTSRQCRPRHGEPLALSAPRKLVAHVINKTSCRLRRPRRSSCSTCCGRATLESPRSLPRVRASRLTRSQRRGRRRPAVICSLRAARRRCPGAANPAQIAPGASLNGRTTRCALHPLSLSRPTTDGAGPSDAPTPCAQEAFLNMHNIVGEARAGSSPPSLSIPSTSRPPPCQSPPPVTHTAKPCLS